MRERTFAVHLQGHEENDEDQNVDQGAPQYTYPLTNHDTTLFSNKKLIPHVTNILVGTRRMGMKRHITCTQKQHTTMRSKS